MNPAGQPARRARRDALHQAAHHRAAVRHRLWNWRVIRSNRRPGVEPCTRIQVVARGRVDASSFRLGTVAWETANLHIAQTQVGEIENTEREI
jgi:hypothetical protein